MHPNLSSSTNRCLSLDAPFHRLWSHIIGGEQLLFSLFAWGAVRPLDSNVQIEATAMQMSREIELLFMNGIRRARPIPSSLSRLLRYFRVSEQQNATALIDITANDADAYFYERAWAHIVLGDHETDSILKRLANEDYNSSSIVPEFLLRTVVCRFKPIRADITSWCRLATRFHQTCDPSQRVDVAKMIVSRADERCIPYLSSLMTWPAFVSITREVRSVRT
jgi:hypothetical protein